MSHKILITGASGYLGGTLLARWDTAQLPQYSNMYALVRSEHQAREVQKYGAEPINCQISDHEAMFKHIVDKRITIIYYLLDAFTADHQPNMIRALGEVRKLTGRRVHFLYTTGAKHFSSDAGVPTNEPLLDTDPRLYEIQKEAKPAHPFFVEPMKSNSTILDAAEENDVRGYIFAPCIVYGEGEGFGNKTSIQDVAIVKAAKSARGVYRVHAEGETPSWPVCHIIDSIELYLQMLRMILADEDIGYGKNGYYLAASGSVGWNEIYGAFAKALVKRNVVDDETVREAGDAELEKMGKALNVPSSLVSFLIGGRCTLTAVHGNQIGWKAQYPPEHILEAADEEVEFILQNMG